MTHDLGSIGQIVRRPFNPADYDYDVDLTRPLVPPGRPTADPALGPGEEITQPRPWQPTHNRLTQLRRHLRRARRDTNRYRRHLDQLTAGLDTAESALIDGHGRVWQPVAGGWHRPDLGTLTGEQVHERYGPTRAVLLIDLSGDEVTP